MPIIQWGSFLTGKETEVSILYNISFNKIFIVNITQHDDNTNDFVNIIIQPFTKKILARLSKQPIDGTYILWLAIGA